jgi:hypothetical protein
MAVPSDRFGRATVRIALRQLSAAEPSSLALIQWLSTHDRLDPLDAEDPMETLH